MKRRTEGSVLEFRKENGEGGYVMQGKTDRSTHSASDASGLVRLSGTVERIVFSSDETGFAICDFGVDEYAVERTEGEVSSADDGAFCDEVITILGTLPLIAVGDALTVYGRWGFSPKYGRQFRVEQYEKNLPADTASILRYLSSRTIKGVGPTLARRIVSEFGVETFDVIEHHPEWLADIKGISRKLAQQISDDFREKSGMRNAMLYFREYFGTALTVRIYKKWGATAVDVARSNPYRLCDEIDGIGFEKADRLASENGIAVNSPERLKSGIRYVLVQNGMQNGHVCLPEDKLIAVSARLLGVTEEEIREALNALTIEKGVDVLSIFGVRYVYDHFAYAAEGYIARKLRLLDKLCPAVSTEDVALFIEKEERESGVEYAALQKQAIFDALSSGVMILTGGPGTGKTTVVRALLRVFSRIGLKVALCAPTGRAAKRLSESTAEEAKTIHRLLEMGVDRKNAEGLRDDGRVVFGRDEKNLLDENVVIVDEASMIDNALLCALLKAVKPGARVILIGDADQLPSVGAGNVLADLIMSECFSTVRLTEIFRQAGESLIITNAHAVNRGVMPDLSVKNNDFFFLPRESDKEIAYTIADLCKNRLPRAYGRDAAEGIQVITPSRRGESGTDALNLLLQSELNPPDGKKKEYHFRDRVFREGDKVMQTRNNYDIFWERTDGEGMGIFNGDIGVIQSIDPFEQEMTILFDDRIAKYDFSLLDELDHAYAVTVHKSQGSEYQTVIFPAYAAPPMLLTRNLLYTAVTRASVRVIIVGREDIVEAMVQNNRQSMRYTGLVHRIKGSDGS